MSTLCAVLCWNNGAAHEYDACRTTTVHHPCGRIHCHPSRERANQRTMYDEPRDTKSNAMNVAFFCVGLVIIENNLHRDHAQETQVPTANEAVDIAIPIMMHSPTVCDHGKLMFLSH